MLYVDARKEKDENICCRLELDEQNNQFTKAYQVKHYRYQPIDKLLDEKDKNQLEEIF